MSVVCIHHPYTYLTTYDWMTRKWSDLRTLNPIYNKLNSAVCGSQRRSLVYFPIDDNTLLLRLLNPEENVYFTISNHMKVGGSTLRWASMPPLKVWEAAVVSHGGVQYHIGGCHTTTTNPEKYLDINCQDVVNVTVTNAIQIFDPNDNEWRMSDQQLSSPKGYCSAVVCMDGMILVSGGYGTGSLITDECEMFYYGTRYAVALLPTPRCLHSSCNLPDNRILVTGGYTYNDAGERVVSNTYTVYDAINNMWTADKPMPLPMSRHGSILMPNGEVLLFGGSACLSNAVSTAYMTYCYDTDTWEVGKTIGAAGGNTASIVTLNDN